MKQKNKKVYIVLTYTGTVLSKIVRFYTRKKYCHVSIALDSSLEKMYSFGRLKAYNPFKGGFVQEGIDIGTFKRFSKTKCIIYSLEITSKQYSMIESVINEFTIQQNKYKFNRIGLFAIAFNYKYKRDNSFYCAEFVKYLLEKVGLETNLPELVTPADFQTIDCLKFEYEGLLKNYQSEIKK